MSKEDKTTDFKNQNNDASSETRSSTGTICLKIVRFTFSTAGLFLINFAYLILGAYIFEYLEKFNEEQECFEGAENYARAQNATMVLMLDVANKISSYDLLQTEGGDKVIEESYRKVLKSFSMAVLDVNYNVSKDCTKLGQPGGPQYAWTWAGALSFSMTIITTIGYGVIAPKTPWGRMVCVAYTIIGLPIMFICLAGIGDVLADIFRFSYAILCCCGCCQSKPKKKKDADMISLNVWKTDAHGNTSIGYNDEDESDDEECEGEDAIITVPLTISLIVLFSFLFLGAALFYVWENFPFVDSFYFCFITFSTIGFGDFAPGTENLDNANSQAQMIVTGVYQILGMAMVSMCFQLMQDEIVAKVNWLLQKCKPKGKSSKTSANKTEGEESTLVAAHPTVISNSEKV